MCKGDAAHAAMVACLLLATVPTQAIDFSDQTAIVEAASSPESSEDARLADAMAAQALERAELDRKRLGRVDWGPLTKLWCEAAIIVPRPATLIECARARLGAVAEMSNPQPSREAARSERLQEALAMVRAALEIAGGDPDISVELRTTMANDVQCLRALVAGEVASELCREPYSD